MRGQSVARWRRSRRGITLVEAIAGSAILGSLLVAILLGAARLQAQAARAQRRIDACRVADRILEGWWAKRDEFPRRAEGSVAGRPGWTWRTQVVENESARALRGEVVALAVFGPDTREGEPVAQVAVFLPEKEDEGQVGPDAR